MSVGGQVVEGLLTVTIALLWVRLVADWVHLFARDWHPSRRWSVVLEAVFSLTDPPVIAVRRLVPAPRVRGVSLDLGVPLVLVVAYLLRALLRARFL